MPGIQSFIAASVIAAASAADWTYSSLGDDWGKTWPICDHGRQQSPIDVYYGDTQLSSDLNIEMGTYKNYVGPNNLGVVDKGYTIQADFPGSLGDNGGFISTFFGGEKAEFSALQMHIHAPSEHTINGYHFDAEIHLVHLYANGTLGGVLGVLFDREKGGDTTNPFIQEMISPNPGKPAVPRNINLSSWLSTLDVSKYYAYPGSLTTPPCTEGVAWHLLMDIQPLSGEQYKWFTELWHANPDFFGHGNYRRPQPRHGRIVQASKQPVGWRQLVVYTGANMLSATTALAALTIAGAYSF